MTASREIIAKTITSAVKDRFKNDPETLTVNSIRTEVEERLGLDAGYLKGDAYWKGESASLVKTTVEKLNEEGDAESAESDAEKNDKPEEVEDEEPSRPTPKSRKPVRRAAPSDDESGLDESPPPSKKRKTSVATREAKSKPEPKRTPKSAATVESSGSELSEVDEKDLLTPEPETKKENVQVSTKKQSAGDFNSSDLSELEDPEPKPKRRSKGEGKSKDTSESKPKAKAASKGKKETAALSPAEEKIKTLQNHLLKCGGIRKIWSRELAKFSTSKEKIKHLEGILHDIGMTGRFSLEKAKAIKER
ncbi:hypothetical protein BJ508DRAFT_416097, partial [Ascobolus immersus RN42]